MSNSPIGHWVTNTSLYFTSLQYVCVNPKLLICFNKLDEAQAGIKIAGRNISNLRYVDDTILMAESEELKSLLMKVKEESEKVGLMLTISEN